MGHCIMVGGWIWDRHAGHMVCRCQVFEDEWLFGAVVRAFL